MANKQDTFNRGFASVDEDKQREIASKGDQVFLAKRTVFHSAGAGRGSRPRGGEIVPDEKRSFPQDPSVGGRGRSQGRPGLA
jgi:hypothetical protein